MQEAVAEAACRVRSRFPSNSLVPILGNWTTAGLTIPGGGVMLLSESMPCPDPTSPLLFDAKGLFLSVYDNNTSSLERTFDVTSSGAEIQFYQHFADGGFPTLIDRASSGTFNFSSVSAAGITGTFSITFADGGLLTGNFDAPRCQAL